MRSSSIVLRPQSERGLPPHRALAGIRQAWKVAAHAQQVMAALNEAYAVLSDPNQRAEYDEHIERTTDMARLAEERARESFLERLEDQGAAWPCHS